MDFRSRRIEGLLGKSLDIVTYHEIASLEGNPDAAEAEDLDWKRQLLAQGPEGKEEFAKDIVSFANHLGGVILVGMADAKGIPSAVMDSDVSDAHKRHLEGVAATSTAPPVRIQLRSVHNPASPGQGFLIIAVPKSPQAPHAVTAPPVKETGQALRYPRRSGSRTRWLSESEVATAYYGRLAAVADRERRLEEIERELLSSLPASNIPHLIVALTPEVPGDMLLSQESFARYRDHLRAWPTSLGADSEQHYRDVRIGSRRLVVVDGQEGGYVFQRGELHRDGSGAFAARIRFHERTQGISKYNSVGPGALVYWLLTGLHLLGVHSRDRAAAIGTAVIRASVVDAPHSHPRGPAQPAMSPMLPLRMEIMDPDGFSLGESERPCAYAVSQAVTFLDNLAEGGVGLVQAAALLADELVQAHGIPEVPSITGAGEIRVSGWGGGLPPEISRWAEQHNVPNSG
ncbi:AlbA family DNA-binding domain-containing protein [Streptacidiphilus fuscans]|uniref:ATP-binding protein n=1 Tax=Streptacidiphilus fuscans TaxID=2789292 RepID=A0A931B7A1_9ACTN|nr:ATP-binding protein [Streptacidiphilus fuscans]MBF9072520.1 ATP-binding protein [Streptacidiphilus fuscans]